MDWVTGTIKHFEKFIPPLNRSDEESLLRDIMYDVLAHKNADVITAEEDNYVFATCFFGLDRHRCKLNVGLEKQLLRPEYAKKITRKIEKDLCDARNISHWEVGHAEFTRFLKYSDLDE